MILGLGSDLIDIRRVEAAIARFGDRFLDQHLYRDRAPPLRAPRQSRPELCPTLRGQGSCRQGAWHRVSQRRSSGAILGVVNLPSGQPGLRLTGGALKRLEAMTPPGMTARLDVTLTDEPPLAQAVVIITALPAVIPAAVPVE